MSGASTITNTLVSEVLNPLIVLLFAIATVLFLWGVAEFIRNAPDSEGRKQGINHMIWGVVGIAIMLSVWGIMGIIADTLGVSLPSR